MLLISVIDADFFCSVTDAAFFILLRICFQFLPIGVCILVYKWVPATTAWGGPQVADGGTASSVEDNCEYIEYSVADSRQGVVLQLGGWARC